MKTMKAMKYLSAALLTALAALAAAGCSADRELPDPTGLPDNAAPETLVLTVETPTDENSQTRVAYDDATLKLTWQTGDQLTVLGYRDNGFYAGNSTDFTYQGKDNQTSGPFEGTAVTNAKTYTIYYPNTIKVTETGDVSFPMEGQTYNPDDPAAGLKNYIILKSADRISPDADFTLTMASSIMKFDLSGIPAEVGKLTKLLWTIEGADGGQTLTLDFPADAVTFSAGNTSLTAYLGFVPTAGAMTKFTVMLVGDKIYRQEVAMPAGKTYAAGSRYTASMSAWTECEQMIMKVQVADDAAGLGFKIPFPPTMFAVPASTVVGWGDDTFSVIPQGTRTGPDDAFNHLYPQAGTYTITITSGKAAAERQIPPMAFSNRNDLDNYNPKKLISVDTPLLNMGASDLTQLFYNCGNLATIPATLFEKNTAAENFQTCFIDCKKLAAIPAGLFDKNTAATNFYFCFSGCNIATLNKNIFSATGALDRFKDQEMNFSYCFKDACSQNSGGIGAAPELWKYERGSATWNTAECFTDARFTNRTSDADGYTDQVVTAWGKPKNYGY